jgi:predicted nucleotidyltransferase
MVTPSLGNALFTTTQQKVLGLLYGKPDESFFTNEIVRWAQVGKGSLVRELTRLHGAGIISIRKQGNQIHYQANPDCPIYQELIGIVRKTFGIAELIRLALSPIEDQLSWACIYGSIAKGNEKATSDIDLMLIGDALQYGDIMELLIPLEEQTGRTINPTLYTPKDWQTKLELANSFVLRVEQQEKIDIIGSNPKEPKDG